jgi:hypothetical protein
MVLTIQVTGGQYLLWRTVVLSGELIPCQSNHDDYVYSHGGVTMLGSDGTDCSTRVSVVGHVWVPIVMSCLV